MSNAPFEATTSPKPLRLWPGVAAAALVMLCRFALTTVFPEAKIWSVLGAFIGSLLIVVWWLGFSRTPWLERLGALVLMGVGLFVTTRVVHISIRTGMMGLMLFIYAVPALSVALVGWAVVCGRLAPRPRRLALVGVTLLACGMWTLLRTEGITGDGDAQLAWRWSKTPEERLTDRTSEAQKAPSVAAPIVAAPTAKSTAEWPGFRGPRRDGASHGPKIQTDWTTSPPVELWRRPIGPGWSSFAVSGDLFYTQEQRGEHELVACYRAATGEPVWTHEDPVRFWESNGGAGPRATPTLSGGRLYAFGATGLLNALDPATGAIAWSRQAVTDTGAHVPHWGFSGSPLVVGDVVIVYAGALVAYDRATGARRWVGQTNGVSYSSPHLMTLAGVPQVLQLNGIGATSVAPADGARLWENSWPGAAIVQPALTEDGDVLISTGGGAGGVGTRRLNVTHGPGGWTVAERWTSKGLKPYFNDYVVHGGHAYGFDGSILACIDLQDGKRKWKGGRYGAGQIILLPDQDLLLALSEEGDLALVGATPNDFTELARRPAIKGKTWNHPVLTGDLLLVRNSEEMAAFRLALANR